jgi:hypothetical protein
MAQYIGLTNQQILKKIQSDTKDRISAEIQRFSDNIESLSHDDLTTPEKLIAASKRLGYSGIKGLYNSFVDSGSALLNLFAKMITEIDTILKSDSVGEAFNNSLVAGEILGYDVADFLISSLGSLIGNFVYRPLHMLGVEGADPNIIIGEDGFIDFFSNAMKENKAKAIEGTPRSPFKSEGFQGQTFRSHEEGPFDPDQIIDQRYSDLSKEIFSFSVSSNKFFKEEVFDRAIKEPTLALEIYEGSRWFEMLDGVAESIGTMGGMFLTGGIAKRFNAGPRTVPFVQSTFFAASVAGSSFNDMIEKGASIDDAYKYATSMAVMETLLENMEVFGTGIKTTGIRGKLLKRTWGELLGDFAEEAFEEIAAEYIQTGFERIGTDKTEDAISNKEFYSNVFFAGIAGGLATLGINMGSSVYNATTLDHKVNKLKRSFQKEVEKNPQRAVKVFQTALNKIVKDFNSKRTRGIVLNKKGVPYIGTMSETDKKRFLNQNSLTPFIELNEKGEYVLNEKGQNISTNSFINTNNGKPVREGEFAHSDSVIGTDLQGGREGLASLILVRNKNATEAGRKAIEEANKRNIPVILYDGFAFGEDFESGFFNPSNGTIYINQSNLTKENAVDTIIRHEMLHMIAQDDPELYENIKSYVTELVDLAFDKDDNFKPRVSYINRSIFEYLGEKRFAERITAAFNDIVKNLLEREEYKKDQEKLLVTAAEIIKEELVAYFIESTVSEEAFLAALGKSKPGLLDDLNAFSKSERQRIKDFAGDKRSARVFKKMQKAYTKAAAEVLRRRSSFDYYTQYVFGDGLNYAEKVFSKKFLDRFSADEIMDAILSMDVKNQTVKLGGKTYDLHEVFNDGFEIVKKRLDAPTPAEIRAAFNYGHEKAKGYLVLLNRFLKYNEHLKKDHSEYETLRNLLDVADDLKNFIVKKDFDSINKDLDKYVDLLVNISNHTSVVESNTQRSTTPEYKDDESKAISRWVTRTVKDLQTLGKFERVSNNGEFLTIYLKNNKDYSEMNDDDIEKDLQSTVVGAMAIILSTKRPSVLTKATEEIQETDQWIIKQMKEPYIVNMEFDFNIDTENGIVEILLAPKPEAYSPILEKIKRKKEEFKKNVLEKQKKTVSNKEVPISDRERFQQQKFYTSRKDAEKIVETIASVLKKVNIDLKNLNVIEPAAGDGSFLDAFEKFGVSTYEAFDITPEDNRIQKQDFLKYSKDFDKNAIVIGNVPFQAFIRGNSSNARNFLIHSFELAPIFASFLPQNFGTSYNVQKAFSSGKKLIYSEMFGKNEFIFSGKPRDVKTVFQIWVLENDSRFDKFDDLKKTEKDVERQKTTDFDSYVLNGRFDRYESARYKPFTFFVETHGKNARYNNLVTDFDLLEPQKHYILVHAEDQSALDILARIDYNALADVGTLSERGFTKSDLIELYNDIKNGERKEFLLKIPAKELQELKTNLNKKTTETKKSLGIIRTSTTPRRIATESIEKLKKNIDFVELTQEQKDSIEEKTRENLKKSGRSHAQFVQFVDVDVLKHFAEFDRMRIYGGHRHFTDYMGALIEAIKTNGFTDMPFLEYNPNNNFVRLGEGNHRLLAAVTMGLKKIPVHVLRSARMTPMYGSPRMGVFLKEGSIKETGYNYYPGNAKPEYLLGKDLNTNNIESYLIPDYNTYFEKSLRARGSKEFLMDYLTVNAPEAKGIEGFIEKIIDFEKMFGIRDFYELDNIIKNLQKGIKASRSGEVTLTPTMRKRIADEKLNEIERKFFDLVISDNALGEFFEKDINGNYVPKSKLVGNLQRKNVVKIGGVEYSGDKYAVNTIVDISETDIPVVEVPYELDKMNEDELQVYSFLRKSGVNFIMYKSKTSELGLSAAHHTRNTRVVFINLQYVKFYKSQYFEVLVHEMWHEFFKYDPIRAKEVAKQLWHIFFAEDRGSKHRVWDDFNALYSNGFIDYLRTSYKYPLNEKQIESLLFGSYRRRANARIDTSRMLDEVTAQIIGKLMANPRVFHEILRVNERDNAEMIFMSRLFDTMYNNPNVSEGVRRYMSQFLQTYKQAYNDFLQDMRSRFRGKKAYNLSTLNNFIKIFTDGKYNTKSQLMAAYMKEKANKKRGDATLAFDNLVYLASELGSKLKKASENYKKIFEDFEFSKEKMEYFLGSNEEILNVGEVIQKYNSIFLGILKTFELQRKENKEFVGTGEPPILAGFKDINDFMDSINEYVELYANLSDELIAFTGLPLETEMNEAAARILSALEAYANELIEHLDTGISNLESVQERSYYRIDKAIKDLNFGEQLVNELDGVYAKILDMRKNIKNNQLELVRTQLDERLKRFKRSLTHSGSRQKESNLREELKIALEKAVAIVETFEKAGKEYSVFKKDFVNAIKSFQAFVLKAKKMDENPMEVKEKYDEKMEVLWDNVATLLNDETLGEILKKGYNTKKIASAILYALESLKTVYYSSITNYEKTLDEFAAETVQKVSEMSAKNDRMNTDGLQNYINFLQPQDFFKIFSDFFEGKDFTLFDDFWKQYYKAIIRRLEIIRSFEKLYESFVKDNPELREYSLNEVLEIPAKALVHIRKDELDIIKKEVSDHKKSIKNDIKELRVYIANYTQQLRDIQQRRHEIKILKPQYLKNSQKHKELVQEEKNLKEERETLLDLRKDLRSKVKSLRKEISEFNEYAMVKQRIALNFPDGYETQYMTRGQLIALYMSVLREVEMHKDWENGKDDILPTNHFFFGNELSMLDNKLLITKGSKYAKEEVKMFTIFTETREELLRILESKINEKDKIIIDFARDTFNNNYDFLNEIYTMKYQTELPRQDTYIPFQTLNSDLRREFTTDLKDRDNVGVYTGMILGTALGATTPLMIENIFNILENHTTRAANYSLDPLITDFQNLLVNKAGGTTLQDQLSGESFFGKHNNIVNFINTMFKNILRYSDLTEQGHVRFLRKMLNNIVATTMMINVPSTIRQFISVSNIWVKQGGNIFSFLKNVAISGGKNNWFKQYLLENNIFFYYRDQFANNPNLAELITASQYYKAKGYVRALTRTLGRPVSWADSTVLVGVFRSYYASAKKRGLSKQDALNEAMEKINEVMLFGVASTETAFRSNFSNSKNIATRIASKFQSENVLHISSLIRDIYLIKNSVAGSRERFMRDLGGFMVSGFLSAIIGHIATGFRGYHDDDDNMAFELLVNEFLWSNLVGAVPIINQVSQMLEFDLKTGIATQFPPQIPLLSEIEKIISIGSTLHNGKNVPRKIIKIFEQAGQITGIPVRNFVRAMEGITRLFAHRGFFVDSFQFFTSQSDAETIRYMIEGGKRKAVETLVSSSMESSAIQNELTRLMMENPDERINLYNVDSFKKKTEDGDYKEYKFPAEIKEKREHDTKIALLKLFNKKEYHVLDDKEKMKVIQRIINYYYNNAKQKVLGEKPLEKSYDEIVTHALSYSK